MLRWISTRLASVVRRDRVESDLERELRFHLDMLTEQHVRAGMDPAAARAAAARSFGQVLRVKEAVRDTWLSRMVETLGQDVRYGLRNLRRNPGFALLVVVTMALGIGANTAIFSVVNGVLLRPLPFRDGGQLVVLRQEQPLANEREMGFSYKEIVDYRTRSQSLDDVVEYHSMWFILLGRPEPERVSTGVVSAHFFDVLGVTPLYGRTFRDADDTPGAQAVLVLSHKYWLRSFGGDPTVVGKVFRMNDRPHEVIGILPPVPQYPEDVDVYMPTTACPFRSEKGMLEERDARMMQAIARLKPGVTLEKGQADLDVVAAGLQASYPQDYPKERGYRARALPLKTELTRSFRETLFVLLGTAGFVLLIVCASVANLMLARMVRREREVAVRSALGASRLRLLRQLLTESTMLALAGGALGLVVAAWTSGLLIAFAERFTTRAAEISIDRTVLLFTLVVSVATGLIFGTLPALASRSSATESLREGTRATHNRQGLRNALIVVQIAVSFMLLIGAGLTVRSLINLQQVDPGFKTDSVLTMRMDINFSKYPRGTHGAFWERIEKRLKAIPGVVAAAGAGTFPLNEDGPFSQQLWIEGREFPKDTARPRVDVRLATSDYFKAIALPLVAGRPFSPDDKGEQTLVVIVNQTMARHYWPGEDPLGKRISGDGGRHWVPIVGVVPDVRQRLDRQPGDEIYVPLLQSEMLSTTWLVRSSVDAPIIARAVRAAVHGVDPDQPVDNFRTLESVRAASLESPKLTAMLLGLFALLALVITAAGIGGVIAFSVNQRVQEFGIRMALGAQRTSVLGLVLRQGLHLVLVGLALGMAGALVLTRVLTTLLFGVQPTDALTFLAVSMVLVAVAAAACLIPARRAASVDPMVALRVG